MRVLICESHVVGHLLQYASLAAGAMLEVTNDVVLGLSRDAIGPFWYEHFVSRAVPLCSRNTIPRAGSTNLARYADICDRLAHWALLERYILEVKPDHVILPTGDRILDTLSLLPRAASRGTEIEVGLQTSVLGRKEAKERLGSRLRQSLIRRAPAVTRFHFVDPTQYVEARQSNAAFASKFRLLPDPVEIFDSRRWRKAWLGGQGS